MKMVAESWIASRASFETSVFRRLERYLVLFWKIPLQFLQNNRGLQGFRRWGHSYYLLPVSFLYTMFISNLLIFRKWIRFKDMCFHFHFVVSYRSFIYSRSEIQSPLCITVVLLLPWFHFYSLVQLCSVIACLLDHLPCFDYVTHFIIFPITL